MGSTTRPSSNTLQRNPRCKARYYYGFDAPHSVSAPKVIIIYEYSSLSDSTRAQQSLVSIEVQSIRTSVAGVLTSSPTDIIDPPTGAADETASENPNTGVGQLRSGHSFLTIEASLFRTQKCNPLCLCRCHVTSIINTPTSISRIIGSMFIGYFGPPILPSRTCTETTCLRQSSILIKINYYFPRWFAARMISFCSFWSSLDDYRMSVKTPRLRHWSDEIFMLVIKGNLSRVQTLFTNSMASPFDVDITDGASLLYVCMSTRDF